MPRPPEQRPDLEQDVVTEPYAMGAGSEGTKDSHPAFGVANVTRRHGSTRALFQSDLLHGETIVLSIHTADRSRDLNHDWVHPLEEVVEVEMSLAQWGSLISSAGIGTGTPVTLRRVARKRVAELPYQPRIKASLDEVTGSVDKMLTRVRSTLRGLAEAIEEKKGVRAVREALRDHENSVRNASSNSRFAVQSMAEAAEKVASDASADIESHVLNAMRATGLDHASVDFPRIAADARPGLVIEPGEPRQEG